MNQFEIIKKTSHLVIFDNFNPFSDIIRKSIEPINSLLANPFFYELEDIFAYEHFPSNNQLSETLEEVTKSMIKILNPDKQLRKRFRGYDIRYTNKIIMKSSIFSKPNRINKKTLNRLTDIYSEFK